MELALVGLGKMGLNMATRLVRGGHRVIGYARTKETVESAIKLGAEGAFSLEEAIGKLTSSPKVVWVMVPSGKTTTETIEKIAALLNKGDIIIDGGNSNYKDTILHAEMLEAKGIDFVDCGTSGGIWGLTEGYSLMIGGKEEMTEKLNPIFETLAPGKETGWGRVGPHGAGHYVKMVHNGIEYGMMQPLPKDLVSLKAKKEFGLDLSQISHIWQNGSVVRCGCSISPRMPSTKIPNSRTSNPGWRILAKDAGRSLNRLILRARPDHHPCASNALCQL